MQQSSHRASIPPCVIVESWLTLGCIFGCARSSAISREAWPGSWAGVYILVCFPWLVELGCTPWCVRLGCAIAMPPSAMRKRPASAMVESGPAVAPAAYEWGCDGAHRPCNGDTAVDATPAQSTIPWNQMGGSPCQGTRVEWALAGSVDEVGGPQCVV